MQQFTEDFTHDGFLKIFLIDAGEFLAHGFAFIVLRQNNLFLVKIAASSVHLKLSRAMLGNVGPIFV